MILVVTAHLLSLYLILSRLFNVLKVGLGAQAKSFKV